jgi:hypothetical protein
VEPVLNVGITKDGIKFIVVTNVRSEREEIEFRHEIVKRIEKQLLEIDKILRDGAIEIKEHSSTKTKAMRDIERRLKEVSEILRGARTNAK